MDDLDENEIIELIRNSLDSDEFEEFVASLWELQGWTTEVTEESNDEGRDVIADRRVPFDETLKIEVKKHGEETVVSSPDIRGYAALPGDFVDLAVVVTSGSFTGPAKREAERHNIKLVNRNRLVSLIQKLNAQKLLTEELDVSDWEEIKSSEYVDWSEGVIGEEKSVRSIRGIGEVYEGYLEEVGVRTVGDLLTVNISKIAAESDILQRSSMSEKDIERWRRIAEFREGRRTKVIDGIAEEQVEKLSEVDIYTVEDLLDCCPKDVASQTDIDETKLKKWVGDAAHRDVDQVTEIEGIGPGRGEDLAEIGIFTVTDFFEEDPQTIAQQTNLSEESVREMLQ